MDGSVDGAEFRRVMGHYPTGVCVVTTMSPDGPESMVVGSFTSVSLSPPLVAFMPDRRSSTWPRIEAVGRFCVNVLAERQRPLCKHLSSSRPGRFDGVPYRLSAAGAPIIEGAVAWIDCRVHAVYDAGDHFIALGLVTAMRVESQDAPLLFLRGQYCGASLDRDAGASAPWMQPAGAL